MCPEHREAAMLTAARWPAYDLRGFLMDFEGLQRILVPVDFSRTSNKAYSYARELARSVGAEIHVLHVLDTHYLTGALHIVIEPRDEMVEKWRERSQEKLNRFYQKREKNGFAVHLHMREGRPHEEILKAAEELGADMIVIGSHGWSGVERYIFGNVARKVVKTSNIPVLVIKLKEGPRGRPVQADTGNGD